MNRTEAPYPKPIITPDERPTRQVVESAVDTAKRDGKYIEIILRQVQKKPTEQRQ